MVLNDRSYREIGKDLTEAQAKINDAFRVLVEHLPDGWEIRFVARHDEAEMELYDPDGECVSGEWDGDCHELWVFIDWARAERGK